MRVVTGVLYPALLDREWRMSCSLEDSVSSEMPSPICNRGRNLCDAWIFKGSNKFSFSIPMHFLMVLTCDDRIDHSLTGRFFSDLLNNRDRLQRFHNVGTKR
jgi:hypothetical protein